LIETPEKNYPLERSIALDSAWNTVPVADLGFDENI